MVTASILKCQLSRTNHVYNILGEVGMYLKVFVLHPLNLLTQYCGCIMDVANSTENYSYKVDEAERLRPLTKHLIYGSSSVVQSL